MLLAAAIAIIFLAAIVRGYSGFGFSLLAITALSLLLPPAEIVPSIFLLEIAASLHLLPGIWRDIHWRSLFPWSSALASAHPLASDVSGQCPGCPHANRAWPLRAHRHMPALAWLCPENHAGQRCQLPPPALAAGVANGAFGIGGPPVILFYFASPAGNIVGRATPCRLFPADRRHRTCRSSPREDLVTTDALFRALIIPAGPPRRRLARRPELQERRSGRLPEMGIGIAGILGSDHRR